MGKKLRKLTIDPYYMLAYGIVASFEEIDLEQVMNDDAYVNRLIIKEAQDLDIRGMFLDVIMEGLLSQGRRVEVRHALNPLGEYFASQFDLKRLRKNISEIIDLS